MTITASSTLVSATGNGVTTVFNTPQFYASSTIQVYLNNVLQVSGYTVAGGNGSTGTVTFSVAPANGVSVVIQQTEPSSQDTTYASFQSNPQVTEARVDKLTLQIQQVKELNRISRFNILSGSGAVGINLSISRSVRHTLTGNTTYSFTNPAPFGLLTEFKLLLTQDATGRTITWPASVKWTNGVAPTVTTASRTYLLSFTSPDGGTTWYGILLAGPYN